MFVNIFRMVEILNIFQWFTSIRQYTKVVLLWIIVCLNIFFRWLTQVKKRPKFTLPIPLVNLVPALQHMQLLPTPVNLWVLLFIFLPGIGINIHISFPLDKKRLSAIVKNNSSVFFCVCIVKQTNLEDVNSILRGLGAYYARYLKG